MGVGEAPTSAFLASGLTLPSLVLGWAGWWLPGHCPAILRPLQVGLWSGCRTGRCLPCCGCRLPWQGWLSRTSTVETWRLFKGKALDSIWS